MAAVDLNLGALRSATEELAAAAEERGKLRKAAREFEGFFVGMLLKQMHSSAVKGGIFGQSSEASAYREMFDEALARKLGEQGAFGIGDMLAKSLDRGDGGAGR
jgi:Rod binding domain-containing protein